MSATLRILLVVVSLFTLFIVIKKIRKAQLQIEYTLFWVFFCGVLVLLSIFPGVAVWFSNFLGLQSPSNLIFLVIIFVLVIKLFNQTLEISRLDSKIQKLVQHEALKEKEESEE